MKSYKCPNCENEVFTHNDALIMCGKCGNQMIAQIENDKKVKK